MEGGEGREEREGKKEEDKEGGGDRQRRFAVLQAGVGYEVSLHGRDARLWEVEEVVVMWSAAGSKDESDRGLKRLKKWTLYLRTISGNNTDSQGAGLV